MTRSTTATPDPTPVPASAVKPSAVRADYFADPTPDTLAVEASIGTAYAEGRALYGDDDSDAWLAALEDGTHPLCRIKTAAAASR